MKRLVALAGMLWSTAMVLCAVAVGSGRFQPVPVLAEGLGKCGGMPCYMGIVLDQTKWDDAGAMLAGQASGTTDEEITIAGTNAPFTVALHRAKTGATVSNTEISFHQANAPTLGTFVALYGPPCMVSRLADNSSVWLVYPFLFAVASSHRESGNSYLDEQSRISEMWLFSPQPSVCKLRIGWTEHADKPWVGFASLEHYGEAPVFSISQ